ncbi:MAG: TonB-dependent receptor [Cytophagaceae bacterium]|nr:TonB-dependent receptor [Cytophagaceae bacterium]
MGQAQNATIQGIVFNKSHAPLADVNVAHDANGTQTNASGYYRLEVPALEEITITFSYLGLSSVELTLELEPDEIYEFNPVLDTDVEQIGTVVISAETRDRVEGIVTLSPGTIRKIPGANPGVENLLQTLPGVSSNNELSTQYAVRGGNYDENLVYVNGIQVYRPFLIRSGQQEGLSFVNPDLVRDVDFSAGGFQARYGDKMSSVLDITYRRPVDFGASVDASLLGVSLAAEGISKNNKFSAIVGARYRDNSLLVNAKQTETNFKPRFTDVQSYLSYRFNDTFELGFLGSIASNRYDYEPVTRQTNFGTISDPIALLIFYDGEEQDRYDTYTGALKATYAPTDDLKLNLTASAYHTQEQEFYDILAEYRIGTPNNSIGDEDIGEVEFTEGIGAQLTHARNKLDALILNTQFDGQYTLDDALLEWGIKYAREDIRDRLQEYEIIDSVGFSVRPPGMEYENQQPYQPYDAPIVPFTAARARNTVVIDRLMAFAQIGKRFQLGNAEAFYNVGVRGHSWTVNAAGLASKSQFLFSPRAQFSIKPDWSSDMVFRISGGVYGQPPFYRELRDSLGNVNPEVKAQKSYHLVLGHDWSFKLWDRPFTLVSEAYYKKMTDVNPYTLENVRIRYRAKNNAEAYAYGLDLRLNGEFVPGTESWVSLGLLQTQENIDERGYIPRPTDQRMKIGVLFQDYIPQIPSMRLYLNMVYQTGLPGGSPSYADPYFYQQRLPFYFRADAGFNYVLVDRDENITPKLNWLDAFDEFAIGIEIFNVFDRLNTITNTFVRDASTQSQYAIPNYLTGRVFNIRLSAKL